jgi:hypothetical protein
MDFHVLKRFRQRFHVLWGQKDITEIVNVIQKSNTEPIYYISNSKRVHIVEYRGVRFGCIYNKLRKRIHTVFPPEWIENGSLEAHILNNGLEDVTHKITKVSYVTPLNNKNKRIVRGCYE